MNNTFFGSSRTLVLMATFNGIDCIEDQLSSILKQTNSNLSLLVSDDFSLDGTMSKLCQLSVFDNRINLIGDKFPAVPSGSAGKNFINLFKSCYLDEYDYVALSDQDDIWFSYKINCAIRALKNSSASGYSSSVIAFWEDGRKKLISQSSTIKTADFLFEGAGQGCTFVIPVNTFKLIQEFCIKYKDEIDRFYYHDWLIYLLVRSWEGDWFFDQNPSMYYRQHQNNDTGSRGSFSSIVKRFDKIRNGWYKEQISIATNLYFLAAIKKNPIIIKFSEVFNRPDSLKRRLWLARFVWQHGRRRVIDRCVLVISSLLGYL